jgi:hypothetical protein
MKRGMAGVVATMLAVSLAGCSEAPSSPAPPDAELWGLVQRVGVLKDRVTASGRITTEQRLELSLLQQDVTAWQARTGRNDISFSTSRHERSRATAVAPGDDGSCEVCPTIRMGGPNGDWVCFLDEVGPCTPGSFIRSWCHYVCFKTVSSIPIKPRDPIVPSRG